MNVAMEENERGLGQEGFCFPACAGNCESSTLCWYLESGASEHMVRDDTVLDNVKQLDMPISIKIAKSGETMIARHTGEAIVEAEVHGRKNLITIQDILVVPGLEYNLLSVRKLELKGFKILFSDGKGLISRREIIVAEAYRQNTLYELKLRRYTKNAYMSTVCQNVDLWHKRVGHISYNALKKLTNLDFSEKLESLCQYCVEGKQTQKPHNQHRIRAKRPLQLVHSDLFGHINTNSYDCKKYVLTFIDDFTHFTVVYALKAKSEVLRYFKLYESTATAHFNVRLSRFRCDNGREYISNDMKNYFEAQGIQYEFTIRYTPQQNGVAERMNRTIIDKARCMLLNSKLSKGFWTEAVLAAVYLINRSPTNALKEKVPAEMWYDEKPNLEKLRIFGCIAYLHIPKELIGGKFESRSKKCFMMGYCINGYRLWCPEDKKNFLGRDIVFDESKFLYEDKITTDTSELNLDDKNNSDESIKTLNKDVI